MKTIKYDSDSDDGWQKFPLQHLFFLKKKKEKKSKVLKFNLCALFYRDTDAGDPAAELHIQNHNPLRNPETKASHMNTDHSCGAESVFTVWPRQEFLKVTADVRWFQSVFAPPPPPKPHMLSPRASRVGVHVSAHRILQFCTGSQWESKDGATRPHKRGSRDRVGEGRSCRPSLHPGTAAAAHRLRVPVEAPHSHGCASSSAAGGSQVAQTAVT